MTSEFEDYKTCPSCHMPLGQTGSGSLTQWIKVCSCASPGPAYSNSEQAELCTNCGKRMDAGRAGTLTQWIFRADLCICGSPHMANQKDKVQPPASNGSTELHEELTMQAGCFPVERYSPLRSIGMGASGTVYLCRDRLLKKRVAVKVLNNLSSDQLVAFQREARATSQIDHPNIVKVLDFGVSDGKIPYMVLEYIDGLSLKQILDEERSLDLEEAVPIFEQICDALSYSHKRKLFHRDLKPTNILVTGWNTASISVKVIDFGVGTTKQEKTEQGKSVAGSPPYMPPDQALGLSFDERSEIYSMGCVMFETLTGRPPFNGDSALQLISLHAHETPPTLSEAHGTTVFPEAVENVIATCLSKSPDARYQTMTDLKAALANPESDSSHDRARDTNRPLANKSSTKFAVIALLAVLLGTAGSGLLIYCSGKQETVVAKPHKSKIQRSTLVSVLDSIESDTWIKRISSDGKEVWNSAPSIKDSDLELLTNESNVRRISIGITDNFTGTGFSRLSKFALVEVFSQSTALTDEGVRELCKFKTLTSFRVALATRLTKRGLQYLETLPHLEHLNLTVMKIPDGAIEVISKIKSLTGLVFYNSSNIKASDIQYLSALRRLGFLDLAGTNLNNDVLPYLTKLKSLRTIRLAKLDLTDEKLELLAELPELCEIDLAENPRLTDQALVKLGGCKNLAVLRLQNCSGVSLAARIKFMSNNRRRMILSESIKIENSIDALKLP